MRFVSGFDLPVMVHRDDVIEMLKEAAKSGEVKIEDHHQYVRMGERLERITTRAADALQEWRSGNNAVVLEKALTDIISDARR